VPPPSGPRSTTFLGSGNRSGAIRKKVGDHRDPVRLRRARIKKEILALDKEDRNRIRLSVKKVYIFF